MLADKAGLTSNTYQQIESNQDSKCLKLLIIPPKIGCRRIFHTLRNAKLSLFTGRLTSDPVIMSRSWEETRVSPLSTAHMWGQPILCCGGVS